LAHPPPAINFQLIRQEQESSSANPFAQAQFKKLSEKYEDFEKLGEGSCGVVYRARSRTNKQEVALKVMRMHDEERLLCAKKEYDLLVQVAHPYIVKALDFFTYAMGAVLVLEFFDGKDLQQTVKSRSNPSLTESLSRVLFMQLLQALAHLHSHGFIHRDVKPANVLVSADLMEVRLVDFNAAKDLQEGAALTMTGTMDYMPPEVLQGDSPSESSDIWGAGLCLHLMLVGQLPLRHRSIKLCLQGAAEAQFNRVDFELPLWSDISLECKEVVLMCLQVCCDMRPQASEILASDWMSNSL
jgi:serine/threonine protein kinase